MFSVLWFGSHPDSGNDDCWSGEDFSTLEEAEKFLQSDDFRKHPDTRYSEFIVIDGDGLPDYIVRNNPFYYKTLNSEWRREQATQAGMMGGTTAYNDAMGY